MPGFTTHYLFGVNTYKQLHNAKFQKILRKHHGVYSLGQQGPDIFFYSLPSYITRSGNMGSVTHTSRTGLFLSYLLEGREIFTTLEERRIAEAYTAGFFGHYLLDVHCHPYVYWKTDFQEKSNRYHSRHIRLEVDIDKELLQFYKHRLPSEFHPADTIQLTLLQQRTVAALLHYAYSKTYPESPVSYPSIRFAIRSTQLGTRFLYPSSEKKKLLLHKFENVLLGYPIISAMIPSDFLTFTIDPLNVLHKRWYNPWDKSFTYPRIPSWIYLKKP